MPVLTAPGDTWGISGPDFLNVFLGALVVFTLVALVIRLSVTHVGPSGPTAGQSPGEAAIVAGGPRRALFASLAALRASKAVRASGKGTLQASGDLPADATPLDRAVYDAAQRRTTVAALGRDVRVQSALTELQTRATSAGWVLDSSAQSRARLGGVLLLALGGFGVVRMVAGIGNDRPVGFLVVLCLISLVLAIVFLRVPRASRAGRAALAKTRERHAHLAPRQAPAWGTYGMTGAAMGVALFGAASLWAADPAFAAEAGLRRGAMGDSGSSGDSGGFFGGGGDGGGGSSCGGGGGGCGGGGGGCGG